MRLRLLHTADLHLGATSYLPNALERQVKTLDWIFKLALERKPDALIIAGDVFDDHEVDVRLFEHFLQFVLNYDRELPCKVLVIEGNHSTSDHWTALSLLARLEKWVPLRSFRFAVTRPRFLRLERFNALLVPYGLVYETILRRYRRYAVKRSTVVVMHDFFEGGEALVNKPVKARARLPYDVAYYYYALGDVHEVGQLPGCPKAWYSGSPIQHTVGEGLPKGVLWVEDPTSPELIETPRHVAWPIVKVKEGEPIPKDAYVIYHGTPPDDLPENVVRVVEPRPSFAKSAEEEVQPFALTAETVLEMLYEELRDAGLDRKTIDACLREAKRYVYEVFPKAKEG